MSAARVTSEITTNVLLVDDRPQNLLALEAILEPLGQNLVKANSGEEALKYLLKADPAVILLDVQMPGIDGFETARLIKERERSSHIPIIFLTAISKEEQFVFQGYTVGAVDYISKPFDPDILRSKVAVFVDLYRKNEQIRRQAEQLRELEVAELRRVGERRYRQLAESMPQIVWTAASDGTPTYYNQRWFDVTGVPAADAARGGLAEAIHADDSESYATQWAHAVECGDDLEGMYRFRRAEDGAYRWHLVRAIPVLDESGVASWIGTATDIDDRKRGEEALTLLAEASTLLSSTLEYRRALADVAQLMVPTLADWCVFEVLEDDGTLRRLAAIHQDARKTELLRDMAQRFPYDPDSSVCPERVMRTGEPVRMDVAGDDDLRDLASSDAHLDALRRLGIRSYMCVPLVARGRALGSMTFVTAESGRLYNDADLTLAQDLARRAALAVDNAQLYEIAQSERERLAEANRAKDEFLAVVSHELRTPLNSILGWTQLLRTGKLDPTMFERALETIERNAKSQAQLINDLLDVSRVITGKLRLKVRGLRPDAIVRGALDSVGPAVKTKNIALVTSLDETAGPISGDPDRLQQVVWNLLSNAIKFTPAGGRIEVTLRGDDEEIVVAVADSGMGIKPEFLPYVFDRFRQADASSTRSFGGLGIGLSIVRNLVELHGGSVAASSEGEGEGATFTVRLPRARGLAEAEEAKADVAVSATEPADTRPFEGVKVLVVEDEEDGKDALKLTLDQYGAETVAVATANEALAAYDDFAPDVLLSDIGLPGESGYDLVRTIREREATRGGSVLAVAVTAFASDADRRRALAAGFQRHVAKPVDPAELVATLRSLLKSRPAAPRKPA